MDLTGLRPWSQPLMESSPPEYQSALEGASNFNREEQASEPWSLDPAVIEYPRRQDSRPEMYSSFLAPQPSILVDPVIVDADAPPSYTRSPTSSIRSSDSYLYPYLGQEPGLVRCPHCQFLGVSKVKRPGRNGFLCLDREVMQCNRIILWCCTGLFALFSLNPLIVGGTFSGMVCCTALPSQQCWCQDDHNLYHHCRNCDKLITAVVQNIE